MAEMNGNAMDDPTTRICCALKLNANIISNKNSKKIYPSYIPISLYDIAVLLYYINPNKLRNT